MSAKAFAVVKCVLIREQCAEYGNGKAKTWVGKHHDQNKKYCKKKGTKMTY